MQKSTSPKNEALFDLEKRDHEEDLGRSFGLLEQGFYNVLCVSKYRNTKFCDSSLFHEPIQGTLLVYRWLRGQMLATFISHEMPSESFQDFPITRVRSGLSGGSLVIEIQNLRTLGTYRNDVGGYDVLHLYTDVPVKEGCTTEILCERARCMSNRPYEERHHFQQKE